MQEGPQRKPASGNGLWYEDELGIAVLGSVCIAVWSSTVTPARHERQRLALETHVARHSGYAGFVCVVLPGSPPPDEAMRKASIEMVTGHGPRLRSIACVIEGSGFRAAATRGVLAGMALLVKVKPELRFVATFEEAALWIARGRPDAPASELNDAYGQLLARMNDGKHAER